MSHYLGYLLRVCMFGAGKAMPKGAAMLLQFGVGGSFAGCIWPFGLPARLIPHFTTKNAATIVIV